MIFPTLILCDMKFQLDDSPYPERKEGPRMFKHILAFK